MKQFDYSPLGLPVSIEDIRRNFKMSKTFLAQSAVVLYLILLGIGAAMINISSQAPWFINSLWFVGIIGVIGIIFYVTAIKSLKTRVRLERFAAANNLSFGYDITDIAEAGMIFGEGYSRSIIIKIGDSVSQRPYEIGNYRYETGSGKSHQVHQFGYLRLRLPRHLPHMVLDAKSNNIFGRFSNLPATFDKDQILSLEGDFDRYFTLYAPKQYEQDALYVFTPDVMAHLIDQGKQFDMEIIDNNLYIYSVNAFRLDKEDTLRRLFAMLSKIGDELGAQTDYYADDAVGNRAIDIVSKNGARLARSTNWLVVTIILVYMLSYVFNFVASLFTTN